MSDLLAEIAHTRREAKELKVGEQRQSAEGQSYWVFDNEPVSEFENFFAPVLDRPISQLVEEHKLSHQETAVMNLMGGPQLLRDLEPTRGVSVRLTDTRTEGEIKEDVDHEIYVLTGDILSKNLWKRMPGGQHFIFSMPQGALYGIPMDENMYYYLLNETWKKLADQGEMFIQVPISAKSLLNEWTPLLNSNPGIKAGHAPSKSQNIDYLALRMVKSSGSPANLPPLSK